MDADTLGKPSIRVGCAGWSIPKEHARLFPATGTHLSRYATMLRAVKINSSFYRLHREDTYRRGAGSVPASFRFSVKMPREITHQQRLKAIPLLDEFLQGSLALGEKLGPLLVQIRASLAFDSNSAKARFHGNVVCEPRHSSWFSAEARALLLEVGRAVALRSIPLLPSRRASPEAQPGSHSSVSTSRRRCIALRIRKCYSRSLRPDCSEHLRRCASGASSTTRLSGQRFRTPIRVLEALGIEQGAG